jgi:hypothetical protein
MRLVYVAPIEDTPTLTTSTPKTRLKFRPFGFRYIQIKSCCYML